MSAEKLYTLAEAKLELNRERCQFVGHDFTIVLRENDPTRVACRRCGRTWRVGEEIDASSQNL